MRRFAVAWLAFLTVLLLATLAWRFRRETAAELPAAEVAEKAAGLGKTDHTFPNSFALHERYARNEAAADAELSGKVVAFPFSTFRVVKGDDGEYWLHVSKFADSGLAAIICRFPPGVGGRLAGLPTKQPSLVRGVCRGITRTAFAQDGYCVLMADCEIADAP